MKAKFTLLTAFAAIFFSGATIAAGELAPLDTRLEDIKTNLWFGAEPDSARDEIIIYSHSVDDTVEIVQLSLIVDEREIPLQPLALAQRASPYHGSQWWRVAAPKVGANTVLHYKVTHKRNDLAGDEGYFSLPTKKSGYARRYELALDYSVSGAPDVTLVEWRDTEADNSLLRFLFNLFLPWGSYQVRYFEPGSADDIAVRYAQDQCVSETPYSGLRVLLDIEGSGTDNYSYWLARARCDLQTGLRRHAEAAMQRAGSFPARDYIELYRLWLDMAGYDYRRAQPERALDIIDQITPDVPDILDLRVRNLRGQVLLALGRNADAVETLNGIDPYSDQNWARHTPRGKTLAFVRYNLAVALLQQGDYDNGYSLLDMLGTALDSDLDLRNQANLLLGWQLLHQERGLSSAKILQRLSLSGPRASRGLLAYGWAQLAAAGEPLLRPQALVVDEPYKELSDVGVQDLYRDGKLSCQDYNRLSIISVEACPSGDTYSGKYFDSLEETEKPLENAAIAWSELTKMDIRDPAVIEGELALAGVYAKLGDLAAGERQLSKMLADIEQVRSSIANAQQSLSDGTLLRELLRENADAETGWWWAPKADTASDAGYLLHTWLAENRTVALLQAIRDTRLLWQTYYADGGKLPPSGYDAGQNLINIEAAAQSLFIAEATSRLGALSSLMQQYDLAARFVQVGIAQGGQR